MAATIVARRRFALASRALFGHFNGVYFATGADATATANAVLDTPHAYARHRISPRYKLDKDASAGKIAEQVLQLMSGPGRKAKPSLVMTVCNSLREPSDVAALKSVLVRFRQKQVNINDRAVNEVMKALCRINCSDLALELLSDPRQYGLFTSRRILNSLLMRYGAECKQDPTRFQKVLDTWHLIQTSPHFAPNETSRVLLMRAAVLAKSPESFAFALKLLESPDAPIDLVKEKRFLFWTVKLIVTVRQAKDVEMSKSIAGRLSEIKSMPDYPFPLLLEAILKQPPTPAL